MRPYCKVLLFLTTQLESVLLIAQDAEEKTHKASKISSDGLKLFDSCLIKPSFLSLSLSG